MSQYIKNIVIGIDGTMSDQFKIEIGGAQFTLDNFLLRQSMRDHSRLSFTLSKAPQEDVNEMQFKVCSDLIGKPITLTAETSFFTKEKDGVSQEEKKELLGTIEFDGFISNITASRNSNACNSASVEALSWDGVLEDNPDCEIWNAETREKGKNSQNMGKHNKREAFTLKKVVEDELQLAQKLKYDIDTAFDADKERELNYQAKWNETTWGFLCRLATRYGEWLYNDGKTLRFGKLPQEDPIEIQCSNDSLESYGVNVQVAHLNFAHVASNEHHGSNEHFGTAYYAEARGNKMDKTLNPLNEAAFKASKEDFQNLTIQNMVYGDERWEVNGTKEHLDALQKPQAQGRKSALLTYSGKSACSAMHIGGKIAIIDNYIMDEQTEQKSKVTLDEILITSITHNLSSGGQYSNSFSGLAANTEYPPYTNPAAIPFAMPCRGWVVDNVDVEKMGRVRVGFAPSWIKAVNDIEALSTAWVRVRQQYASYRGSGMYVMPEIGDEVIVDFEGGNAEKPIVVGSVYNGNHDDNWHPYDNNPKKPNLISNVPSNNFYDDEQNTKDEVKWVKPTDLSFNRVKAFRTRNGHTIEFHDESTQDAFNRKDPKDIGGYIRIYDAYQDPPTYELLLSADKKLIKIKSYGDIQLEAGNDIKMNAKNDIIMNAKRNIKVIAEEKMGLLGNENLYLRGRNYLELASAGSIDAACDGNICIMAKGNCYVYAGDEAGLFAENEVAISKGAVLLNLDYKNCEYACSIEYQSVITIDSMGISIDMTKNPWGGDFTIDANTLKFKGCSKGIPSSVEINANNISTTADIELSMSAAIIKEN